MATITGKQVGPEGFGLMSLTTRPTQTPDAQAFAVLTQALESGATLWSSAEFYGPPDNSYANLKLLKRFLKEQPEAAKKAVFAIKGGLKFVNGRHNYQFDLSPANLRSSIENMLQETGLDAIDVFLPGRLPPGTDVESVVGALDKLRKEGLICGIGLSEVSAATIHKAAKVAKIDLAEIELSLFTTDALSNGIVDACAEHGIPIAAYSPLSRGFLAGSIRSREDFDPKDLRLTFPRFSEENFPKNIELIDQVKKIAEKKGVTIAQIAIAWVAHQKGTVIPIPGTTSVERLNDNLGATKVGLSQQELAEIDELLKNITVGGDRYPAIHAAALNG